MVGRDRRARLKLVGGARPTTGFRSHFTPTASQPLPVPQLRLPQCDAQDAGANRGLSTDRNRHRRDGVQAPPGVDAGLPCRRDRDPVASSECWIRKRRRPARDDACVSTKSGRQPKRTCTRETREDIFPRRSTTPQRTGQERPNRQQIPRGKGRGAPFPPGDLCSSNAQAAWSSVKHTRPILVEGPRGLVRWPVFRIA